MRLLYFFTKMILYLYNFSRKVKAVALPNVITNMTMIAYTIVKFTIEGKLVSSLYLKFPNINNRLKYGSIGQLDRLRLGPRLVTRLDGTGGLALCRFRSLACSSLRAGGCDYDGGRQMLVGLLLLVDHVRLLLGSVGLLLDL